MAPPPDGSNLRSVPGLASDSILKSAFSVHVRGHLQSTSNLAVDSSSESTNGFALHSIVESTSRFASIRNPTSDLASAPEPTGEKPSQEEQKGWRLPDCKITNKQPDATFRRPQRHRIVVCPVCSNRCRGCPAGSLQRRASPFLMPPTASSFDTQVTPGKNKPNLCIN